MNWVNRKGRYYLQIILLLWLVACGPVGAFGPTEPQIPVSALSVDPLFKEFYQALGGQEVLGLPLSGVVELEGKKCQYVEAALMCFYQNELENSRRYALEGLGYRMGVKDDPGIPVPLDPGDRDLGGGYSLYHEFIPLYDRLYGALYAGRPLTRVRVNHETRRFEQFFENVGFYRRFDDPKGQVHLLPYGEYLCGAGCSRNLKEYWSIVRQGEITQPFELALYRLGWNGFGRPLGQARRADDGMIEQLYDRALLYAAPDDLAHPHLRPLALWLGVQAQPLTTEISHEQLVFYGVENGLGHNVPVFFDAFIAAHGGRENAGHPLTEFYPVEGGRYRQCFENYCLEYDPSAPSDRRVRLVDLGWEYAMATEPAQIARRRFDAETLTLQLSEAHPQLARGAMQVIQIQVISWQDGQGIALATGTISLHLPGQEGRPFPPTNEEGRSEVTLPPLEGLPPMSVVEYQVCLDFTDPSPVCAVDSFVYRGD
ncbi:MAG TPA: hypothetical protein DEQ80_07590 [Anaerolinea thermolimosa]|uniref:Uncharacterized protein n=1 Tax=Anaerolinea thermolimosa TaxID=229919 RepID=A0A3D1JHJ9_9CHLR|nr:hypothetical protein [Anaerolinea thermolimosa]GAP08641.1 hypothetical protein ATHL_03546 [Anaerolinea thermolimosa]HCE17705.1 hypothetical protein [Anaerolinea thermolimosa]